MNFCQRCCGNRVGDDMELHELKEAKQAVENLREFRKTLSLEIIEKLVLHRGFHEESVRGAPSVIHKLSI